MILQKEKVYLFNDFDVGPIFTKQKRTSNMLKMLTAVLKFIVDASSMRLPYHDLEKCLEFTLEYVKFMSSTLRIHVNSRDQFMADGLRETFCCLRSSITYVAKFLGLLLRNSSEASLILPTLYNLVNYVFDFIVLVEECLGSRHAASFVSAVKPWMPDLILALGCWQLLKQDPMQNGFPSLSDSAQLWATVLAKTEEYKLQDIDTNDSRPQCYSAFNKLAEMMVQQLRANFLVLDAIGVVFLNALLLGLERRDFNFVLGLLHFVCMRLVGHEGVWKELKLMLTLVQVVYPRIEIEVEDPSNTNEGRQKLEKARLLLEPVWLEYLADEQGDHHMEI